MLVINNVKYYIVLIRRPILILGLPDFIPDLLFFYVYLNIY